MCILGTGMTKAQNSAKNFPFLDVFLEKAPQNCFESTKNYETCSIDLTSLEIWRYYYSKVFFVN